MSLIGGTISSSGIFSSFIKSLLHCSHFLLSMNWRKKPQNLRSISNAISQLLIKWLSKFLWLPVVVNSCLTRFSEQLFELPPVIACSVVDTENVRFWDHILRRLSLNVWSTAVLKLLLSLLKVSLMKKKFAFILVQWWLCYVFWLVKRKKTSVFLEPDVFGQLSVSNLMIWE